LAPEKIRVGEQLANRQAMIAATRLQHRVDQVDLRRGLGARFIGADVEAQLFGRRNHSGSPSNRLDFLIRLGTGICSYFVPVCAESQDDGNW
jgi:hypothetical protein